MASVAVRITGADETVIEQGTATKSENDSTWTYVTTAVLPVGQNVAIEVTAVDRPGNKTTETCSCAS